MTLEQTSRSRGLFSLNSFVGSLATSLGLQVFVVCCAHAAQIKKHIADSKWSSQKSFKVLASTMKSALAPPLICRTSTPSLSIPMHSLCCPHCSDVHWIQTRDLGCRFPNPISRQPLRLDNGILPHSSLHSHYIIAPLPFTQTSPNTHKQNTTLGRWR